jgi:hypothetical protein
MASLGRTLPALAFLMSLSVVAASQASDSQRLTWRWEPVERLTYVSAERPISASLTPSSIQAYPVSWYKLRAGGDPGARDIEAQMRLTVLAPSGGVRNPVVVTGDVYCYYETASGGEVRKSRSFRLRMRIGQKVLLPGDTFKLPRGAIRPRSTAYCGRSFTASAQAPGAGSLRLRLDVDATTIWTEGVMASYGFYKAQDCTVVVRRNSERRACRPLRP